MKHDCRVEPFFYFRHSKGLNLQAVDNYITFSKPHRCSEMGLTEHKIKYKDSLNLKTTTKTGS